MNHLAILIPYYEGTDLPEDHFTALERLQGHTSLPDLSILALDDASDDGTTSRLRAQGCFDTVATHQKNTDYTGAVNDLIRIADRKFGADVVCILDQDSTIAPPALRRLCELLDAHEELGVLQPLAQDDRNGVYSFGHRFNDAYMAHPIQRARAAQPAPIGEIVQRQSVTFIGTLVRTAVFEEIGLLEEAYRRYWESSDFCFRAQQHGWDIAVTPAATVVHDRYLEESTAWHLQFVYRNWVLFWSRFNPEIATEILERFWPSEPAEVDVSHITPDVAPLDDPSFLADARAAAVEMQEQLRTTTPPALESNYSVPTHMSTEC